MTTHDANCELHAAVATAGGAAVWYSDNGYVGGRPEDVWPALEVYQRRLKRESDLEMCMPKSECYSPNGNYGRRPAECPIGVLRDAARTDYPAADARQPFLTYSEAAAGFRRLRGAPLPPELAAEPAAMWRALRAIDLDGDGLISAADLQAALAEERAAHESALAEAHEAALADMQAAHEAAIAEQQAPKRALSVIRNGFDGILARFVF